MGGADGVEVRPGSIRLFFVWNGVRHKETLTIAGQVAKPTPANILHARREAKRIREALALGTFVLAEFFPDSPRAEQSPAHTFGQLADRWLATKAELKEATHDQYRNALGVWKNLLGADTPIRSITYQVIASKIGETPWASARLLNNYLIPLRGVFKFEFHGPKAGLNPMQGINNRRRIKKLPDPLTAEERDRIVADMRKRQDTRVWAYFQFAFYSGMRPEEMIALRWADIDWNAGVARVQRVRTFRGSERDGSKTHTERDVDLMPMALEALEAMKPLTMMKGGDVFENPGTGQPWHDERSQRDTYWKPTLRRLGIRSRRAYCTRHTWCTVALMAGVNPAYIAAQAGHSVRQLLTDYARWIGGDGGRERANMEAAMGKVPQQFPNDDAVIGRRDWTRTNHRGKTGSDGG